MGFGESVKKWVAEALFLSGQRRTTSATFLGSISTKISTNTCPGGGSRQMVSHSRKVSIKGSNFPKNRLFRVQNGTMFVPRLRVTDAEASFHTLQDIPQIYPSWVTFAEGCISSCPRPNVFESCATVSAMAERGCLYFFQTYSPGGAQIADLHWSLHYCTFSSFMSAKMNFIVKTKLCCCLNMH